MALSVGEVVEGKVAGITHFGAFVELPDGRTGLVHISEVADSFVEDVKEYVKINDMVKVKILSFDDEGRKIGLSIRQAQPGYKPSKGGGGRRGRARSDTFEDKLAKFIKDSDKRQADLRKGSNGRRGRGRTY